MWKQWSCSVRNAVKVISRLTRWEDYSTFIQFVIGYFLIRRSVYSLTDWLPVLTAFIAIVPLTYGGLYALNDILDREQDAQHPVKRYRPIPSGQISVKTAGMISFGLIIAGLLFAFLTDPRIGLIVLLFLVINLIYNFAARSIPYVDILFNALPHLLRFCAGMWLAAGVIPSNHMLLTYMLGAVPGSVFKRILEMKTSGIGARTTLKYFSESRLFALYWMLIGGLLISTAFSSGYEFWIGMIWICFNLTSYFGYTRSKSFQKFIEFSWR